jgi:hypothetical protein
MVKLLHKSMNTKGFNEDCVLLFAVGEELGEDNDVRVHFTSLSDHVLTDG